MSTSLASRIVYKTVYFFLNLILILLLLLIPADVIRQSVHTQSYNILVIALCYILTILIVAFIYATRLYINRSVLASIPKSWIPIEKGDVNKHVRKMIAAGLSRSAAVAYESRPRIVSILPEQGSEDGGDDGQASQLEEKKSWRVFGLNKAATVEDEMGINIPPHKPVWGEIEHPGWASPKSPDLPDVQYTSVILELPNLIEAKALTLAPTDRNLQVNPPVLDPEAVSLLQRSEKMGLRDYLAHLAELQVLETSPTVSNFITTYELARFSSRPISNKRFRELMHLFAEVLRSMRPLDPAMIDAFSDGGSGNDEPSDDDMSAPFEGIDPPTPRTQPSAHGRWSPKSNISRSTSSSTASSQLRRPSRPVRNSSANTAGQYRTAPTTPKSRRTAISRSSSMNSFAQTRNPYPISQGSSASLRSNAGSVIRLSERADSTELPYVLTLTSTR